MKKKILPAVCLLTATLLRSSVLFSDPTGAAFLKIPAGARASAMGSAFTAVSDDASAIYWNPSGTADLKRREVFLMHSQWISNMNYELASVVQPFGTGAVGIGVAYLAQGVYEGRDEERKRTQDFTASDLAASFSFSRKFGVSNYGVNLKLIHQNIDTESALGFALDAGAKFQKAGSPLSLGLALQNIGPQMKFVEQGYDLPLTLSAGAAYRIWAPLSFALDLRQRIYTGNTSVSAGMEYWAFNTLAIRTGYISNPGTLAYGGSTSKQDSELKVEKFTGLGFGIGLKIFGHQIDYALVPYGELGIAHQISMLAHF